VSRTNSSTDMNSSTVWQSTTFSSPSFEYRKNFRVEGSTTMLVRNSSCMCFVCYLLIIRYLVVLVKQFSHDEVVTVYRESICVQVYLSALVSLDTKVLIRPDLSQVYGYRGHINILFPRLRKSDEFFVCSAMKHFKVWFSHSIISVTVVTPKTTCRDSSLSASALSVPKIFLIPCILSCFCTDCTLNA